LVCGLHFHIFIFLRRHHPAEKEVKEKARQLVKQSSCQLLSF
jgi:hypothetical protein